MTEDWKGWHQIMTSAGSAGVDLTADSHMWQRPRGSRYVVNRAIFMVVILGLSTRHGDWVIKQDSLLPWLDQAMTEHQNPIRLIAIATALDLLDARKETRRLTKAMRAYAERAI